MSDVSLVGRLTYVYRAQGPKGVVAAVVHRLVKPKAAAFATVRDRISGGTGFEIGGPSSIFDHHGLLPVYPLSRRIDNCNFAAQTLWEADAFDGSPFRFSPDREPGRQWLAEATSLNGVASEHYDFVLSSHALEHTANPLKALAEWRRILRDGGTLVLVLPHRDATFDHRRPVTTLEHLIQDYTADRAESDLTHLEEILALHDFSRDPEADPGLFHERLLRNAEHRMMHHHVFDTALAVRVAEHAGFHLLAVEAMLPNHIIVVGEKLSAPVVPWARPFRSPFRTDRRREATR